MDLELLKTYALSFVGVRYTYGGDDPVSGFDCSGFVSELLRASGVEPYNFRTTAQEIYSQLHERSVPCSPQLGALSFYGKSNVAIDHVGFCLDSYSMVEAGGGTAETKTTEIASLKNAFVRLRPVRFRKDYLFTVMPKYP